MIGFMPCIYPDELMYSWFCRYFVHSGYATNKMALNDLLYNRHCNPSKEFIGHLNPDMEQFMKRLYPGRQLVLEHTMFPQYARFIEGSKKKNALYHLEQDFCDAHHLFAILPRSEGDHFLKYCPLCAAEERNLYYGEAYWHRKHQIRNMNVCTRHRCRLVNSEIPAKSDHVFTLDPAETAIKDTAAESVTDPCELEFACYMEKIFDSPMDFQNDIPIGAVLYFGMEGTKYMSKTCRIRNTRLLADDMQDFFSKIGLADIASYYQIQRTLLGSRSNFFVVSQMAFFLGMPVESLVSPELSEEQLIQERNARNPKREECPQDWNIYDEEMAPVVEQAAYDIYHGNMNDAGRPDKVTERLIKKYTGLTVHRLENMPKCCEILRGYKETYDENWARRMVWAYKKLKAERQGGPVFWTDIRKLAGVKKHKVSDSYQYLERYSNRDIADEIISLTYNDTDE